MIGQDFTDRLGALVADLQTKGKGQTVNIMFRNPDNTPNILPLSSDANGVVNAAQLAAITGFIQEAQLAADEFAEQSVPVTAAAEAFRLASVPHEALSIAATNARKALTDALAADVNFQTAKIALDAARNHPVYIGTRDSYAFNNVSENFAALGQAKGEYIGVPASGGVGSGGGNPPA